MMCGVMKRLFAYILGAMLVYMAGLCHAAAVWQTDFDQAVKQAAAEGKYVLVDFTGSDWCHWCVVLREKVLSTPEFEAFAAEKGLLLVEQDFPRTPGKATPEQMEAREKVREAYGVKGFPTVMLADGKAQPFAILVGSAVEPQEYIARLQTALEAKAQFDQAIAEAAKLEGVQRAQAEAKALELLPADCRSLQEEVVDEICRLDPEDTTGLRKAREQERLLKTQMKMLADFMASHRGPVTPENVEKARVEAEELLKQEGLLPIIRLGLLKFISDCYALTHDLPKALENLKAAVAAAPGTPEAERLQQWVANMQACVDEAAAKKSN